MVTRIVATEVARRAGSRARKTARAVQSHATRAASGILGLAGERMTKVDTAWLRMDSPSNLMVIVGVWTLKPGISYAELCKRVEERLLKYNRFRQRVVEDAAGATWVEDAEFDIANQVVREKLPKAKGATQQQALQKRVGELAMEPLDRAHPLWRIHLVEDYEGGSALIVRIHHCIADGIALISVTMSLVDGGAAPPERRRKQAPSNPEEWIADTLIKPFTDISVKALGKMGEGAAKSLEMLRDPQQGLSSSFDVAKVGLQLVNDAAALLLMPDDSKTRLKGKPGRSKRVAWCPPVPLEEVKAVGKALNCSINDVLLSCVAGAIGEYLRELGDDVDGQEIRAMVPVNLRPMEQAYKLGNRFGLVPLVLPIGIQNPIERVYEVRRRMNALKGSTQPVLAFLTLALSGLLIKPAQDAITSMFGRKTTAVMTNVPGPREKLKFLGSTIEQTLFWVPQSGDIGLGVSILSYGGGVQFGVITDTTLCPDPQKIIDQFEPEFGKLSVVTLMLPWGE
ncbi:wax ester/triacylglycerol synthase family O-acyltransferase [Ramlibacter sp. PS4R-6]|uniref:wax ester/triacylglycerol synthase family O-acyltransferase n=1 Tax=Ramlibacter sp. PS4R-6 TaxID=3133438 RepID=UPI0030A90FEB